MGNIHSRTETKSPKITRIEIKSLFGRYDYDLQIQGPREDDASHMAIIYGDNGTGKTTILALLFHLLSPSDSKGHRTYLAQVPFKRFSVFFSDKSKINVVRKGTNLLGTYSVVLTRADGTSLTGEIETGKDNEIKLPLSKEGNQIIEGLSKLGLASYFLRDDRILESDEFRDEPNDRGLEELKIDERGKVVRTFRAPTREAALRRSLELTTAWVRSQLIQESSRGEAEAQQIYASIVRKLNKVGVPKKKDYVIELDRLITALFELDTRSRHLAKFGLIPKISVKPLINGLTKSNKEVMPFVAQVVSSFIDGQNVRIGALEELNRKLNHFVELINGFIIDKKIDINIAKGITILTDSDSPLQPEKLSSGEKQLLLLLCNVLTAGETASLFIIDEPEISLNVKWQRHLIDALTDITRGNQCQFLFATHSIELLAKHREQVIKLNPN